MLRGIRRRGITVGTQLFSGRQRRQDLNKHDRAGRGASEERVTISRSPHVDWWRRRELNPGPKTFSTTDLHV